MGASASQFVIGVATTLVASAVLALSLYSWNKLRTLLQKRGFARSVKRSTSKHPESLLYLVRRYGAEDSPDLFVTRTVAPGTQVAFYSPASWNEGPYLAENILDFSNYVEAPTVVDTTVLKQFKKRVPMTHEDGTPWNDDILIARCVEPGPIVRIGRSNYFSFLSSGGALQLELETATHSWLHRTPLRDRLVPRLENFADGSLPLNPVGANVATILLLPARDGRPPEARVLLQKRANNVAVFPGLHNVVPSFQILAPENASSFDVRNDLVREYLEELLEFDDVVHTGNRRQASSLWYLGEAAAERLLQGLQSGTHRFEILGIGVDLVHAGLHLACVLVIKSSRQELYEMKANWEGRLFDIDILSPDIDRLVAAHEFQPDGAFAIDLARMHLARIAPNYGE